jgi:hypothetical protein
MGWLERELRQPFFFCVAVGENATSSQLKAQFASTLESRPRLNFQEN